MNFLDFFLFLGDNFDLPCQDPDPDRLRQLKPDPDQKNWLNNNNNFLVARKPGGGLNGWSPS